MKRIFDLLIAVVIIVLVLSWLLPILALLILLDSKGPVFFVQKRVGRRERLFACYKLRTMVVNDQADHRPAAGDDARITRLGSWLRRSHLDELPQFFNVLWGDMSVVGPRPEMPHFVERHLERVEQYNARHFFKVGITGWAQVNGWRGDTSITKRVEYDLYYLRNWSLTFDLQIMTMTILRIFNSKNAY